MWRALLLACAVALLPIEQVKAQQRVDVPSRQILVVDTDQLFNQSEFGQKVANDLVVEGRELAAEFRVIEGALSQEELELTQLRATMDADAFRILADAFDQKVQSTRAKQLERSKALNKQIDMQRVTFLNTAAPILQELMNDAGALVLLERRNVIFSVASIDITIAAIAQIDRVLGDGSQPATSGD